MDNLARAYAGLTLSDKLLAKAIALSEVSQMVRVETLLREYLIATWQRRQNKAVKRATALANQGKPANQIANAIAAIMEPWEQEALPALQAAIEKTYKLAREAGHKKANRQTTAPLTYPIPERADEPVEKAAKGKVVVGRLRPSFDLADKQAIGALKKHQTFWIGKHYKNNVSPAIAQVTRETMTEVGRTAAVAGTVMAKEVADTLSHVKVPGGYTGTASQYYTGLTANAMTVARVHGQVRSFMEIGITTYHINAVGDKRTCDRCTHMDGKTFKTQQGAEQMQREVSATNPDAVKAAHPWMSLGQLKAISPTAGPVAGKAGDKDSTALAGKGQSLPPYHFKCRCTVDIGTDSKTYQSLQPLTAPMPGKPIVPKLPPRAANTKEWAKGLSAKEKAAFHHWSGGGFRSMRDYDMYGKVVEDPAHRLADPTMLKRAGEFLGHMRQALSKASMHNGVVYRGLRDIDVAVAKKMTRPGYIFEQKSISSWTKKKEFADKFTGGIGDEIGIRMEVKTSKGAFDISSVVRGKSKKEAEVVLEKGKRMMVVKSKIVKNQDGFPQWHVILKEVD